MDEPHTDSPVVSRPDLRQPNLEAGWPIAVALGSNLGDRERALVDAVERLRQWIPDPRCSSVYETAPMYVHDQPSFLNACCVGTTRLEPDEVLRELQVIESTAGRRQTGVRYGPRILDLDLLLYADRVVRRAGLTIPHPRLRERPFVLGPMAEIASEWVVPAGGPTQPAATVGELAAACAAAGLERRPWPSLE